MHLEAVGIDVLGDDGAEIAVERARLAHLNRLKQRVVRRLDQILLLLRHL
jgi:hypothetical protein